MPFSHEDKELYCLFSSPVSSHTKSAFDEFTGFYLWDAKKQAGPLGFFSSANTPKKTWRVGGKQAASGVTNGF